MLPPLFSCSRPWCLFAHCRLAGHGNPSGVRGGGRNSITNQSIKNGFQAFCSQCDRPPGLRTGEPSLSLVCPVDLSWFRLASIRQNRDWTTQEHQAKLDDGRVQGSSNKYRRAERSRRLLLCSASVNRSAERTRPGGRGMRGCWVGSLERLGMGPPWEPQNKTQN